MTGSGENAGEKSTVKVPATAATSTYQTLMSLMDLGGWTGHKNVASLSYATTPPMEAILAAAGSSGHEVDSGITTRELYDGSPIEEVD